MKNRMAIAAMLATVACGAPAQAAATNVTLQLSGPAQFEFAGYYAALWQGFYRAAGLEVRIKPGSAAAAPGRNETPIEPRQAVADGDAAFGVAPAGALVIRAAQGQALVLLAPIFQRSGAEIYYRAGDDYASPGALAGARVGRLAASNILDIEMATALQAEGLDPDKLNSTPLQPGDAVAALAGGRVDAVPGSAWTLPWLAHEKGFAVKAINPADYRVEFYGDTLFATQRFAADHPELVRAFRTASLQGWAYALARPDAIAARLLHDLPQPSGIADATGFEHYQAALARALARYPAVALGHSNPYRWGRIEASLAGVRALVRTAEPADFVYDADAGAHRRDELLPFEMLGVALALVLAVVAWLRLGQRLLPDMTAWLRLRWRLGGVMRPRRALPMMPAAPATGDAASPPPPSADLNAVLGRLERALRRRLPRGVRLRLSLLPALWGCHTAPAVVRRLVLDLVSTAAADLKDGGEVLVGTRNFAFDEAAVAATPDARLGAFARVTVRDNGAGLSEPALAQIFDPATTARPAVAVAAATLRGEGGFVRVESAPRVGTAVHLYFPRAVAADIGAPGKPAAAAE
jgi:ABC-type nitrate/sulfonate/bicarbonate transport system substrate-binding protein